SANNALAKHYHRLGIDAGIKGAYRISSNYFKYVENLSTNAFQLTEHLQNVAGDDTERVLEVNQASEKRKDLSSLMSGISNLTIRYQTEINKITEDENYQSNEEIWSSIQEDAESFAKGDLAYISLLPIMYQNIANVSQLIVKNELPSTEIVETTEKIVGQFMQRLVSGTETVFVSWREITSQERSTMRQKLEDLLITIKYLTQSLALMPQIANPRIRTINRLRTMRYLIESVIVELDSSSLETGNRILELVLKAKAHFFATKARLLAEELPDGDVPIEQIKGNYSGTYISGIQIQMNIFQLTAQYAVLNYVLITLLDTLSITKDKEKEATTEQILEEVEKDFEATKMFERMLERIRDDCTALLIHRRKEGDVVKGVPWESFARREKLIQGILMFY
ncbi:MAG: hypothetical protein KAR35_11760, partial [Candidatus Heimdallarchaeota archaeon]|nr:hypothetical protein [Candidatus Heimdallarchaeota archaeon]MCK5050038.1 hypothetical protein [Candidatus Heimdallarchaeota archaeon]